MHLLFVRFWLKSNFSKFRFPKQIMYVFAVFSQKIFSGYVKQKIFPGYVPLLFRIFDVLLIILCACIDTYILTLYVDSV